MYPSLKYLKVLTYSSTSPSATKATKLLRVSSELGVHFACLLSLTHSTPVSGQTESLIIIMIIIILQSYRSVRMLKKSTLEDSFSSSLQNDPEPSISNKV